MLVGKELGPYVVDKELGSGAMGTVFRARHKQTGEKVAVKVVIPAVASNESALARFTRECAILKQMSHPNIVRYKGSGRYHGAPFYIMEYVHGESLDKVMARRGRMTWEEVVDLGVPLCAALQHAHDKGIIHRDLKPSNIMILPDGTVKLTDFGIAKDTDVTALTAANATVGTAAYMSPEQCRGSRDINHKSDLYSLGVMFYELITGRKPFVAETAMEMFLKHAGADFVRPSKLVLDMPVWLDTLICQMMEKKPELRPLNAAAVGDALKMVREKVEAQQSAGIDAATKRRVDRTKHDTALDETDKDAARTLLGKKKKKKAVPFYRKNWFTVSAVAVIAVALLVFLYVVFLRPPSAESLYAQAEPLMKSPKLEDHRAARDGPIADFLRYHPDDPKAGQVQAWADQAEAEDTENAMTRRRGTMAPMNDAEKAAREALDLEDMGRLPDAARRWRDVARFKASADRDVRGWGLVGEKRLKDLDAVGKLHEDLKGTVHEERILQKKHEPRSSAEGIALDAVREEMAGHLARAKDHWEELKRLEAQPEQHLYRLLAARQVRELGAEPK